jgi:G3E family GTPase
VTVVDAVQLWSCLAPPEGHRNPAATPGDGELATYWPQRRSEATLEAIVEQIECCDCLVLLGMGSLGQRERDALEKLLPWLQPRARLVTFETLPDAAEFFAAVAEAPRFAGEGTREGATVRALPHMLANFEQPAPRATGLAEFAFVYRRRRPFHPVRFAEFLERWPENAVRTLGTLWLATADDVAYSVNHFGPVSMTLAAEGYWLAALSPEETSTALSLHPEAGRFWDETYRDRFTEIVFLGEGLDRMAIAEALDACLLTDWEMRQDWNTFDNPFGKLDQDKGVGPAEAAPLPPTPRFQLVPGGLTEPPGA